MQVQGKRILVVAPHLDDEVLGATSVLLDNPDAAVLFLCNRHYDHIPDHAATEKAHEEALRAQEILGYGMCMFRTNDDEHLGVAEAIVDIEQAAKGWCADWIVGPYRHDPHQDHRAAAHACEVVSRWKGLLTYFVPSATTMASPPFDPQMFIEMSEDAVERKLLALARYEREMRQPPHPRASECVQAQAKVFGSMAGLPAAEAFMVEHLVAKMSDDAFSN